MNTTRHLLLLILLFFTFILKGDPKKIGCQSIEKLTFKVPESTPKGAKLFLLLCDKGLVENSKKYPLEYQANGDYTFAIKNLEEHTISYKIALDGDQKMQEIVQSGAYRLCREFSVGSTICEVENELRIERWAGVYSPPNTTEDAHRLGVLTVSTPSCTPDDAILYLVGDFNGWRTQDEEYKLQKHADGRYTIDLSSLKQDTIRYKIVRDGVEWNSVEMDKLGKHVPDRFLVPNKVYENEDHIVVESWNDLEDSCLIEVQLEVEVSVTDGKEDLIYLVLDVNDWRTHDPVFIMHKNSISEDGAFVYYTYNLKVNAKEFRYKYHNSKSFEGWEYRAFSSNRKFKAEGNGRVFEQQRDKIEIWNDRYSKFGAFTLLLLLSVLQAFLMSLVILFKVKCQSFRKCLQTPNFNLLFLTVLIATLPLLKVLSWYPAIFDGFPSIWLLPNLLFFSFMPTLLIYLKTLLSEMPLKIRTKVLYFLPLFLQFLVFFYWSLSNEWLIDALTNNRLTWVLCGFFLFALLYNSFLLFKCREILVQFNKEVAQNHSFEQNVNYLNIVLIVAGVSILLWWSSSLVWVMQELQETDYHRPIYLLDNMAWLMLSLTPFILAYYAISQPEILKPPAEKETIPEVIPDEKNGKQLLEEEALVDYKKKLSAYMESHQPYLRTDLKLEHIAEELNIGKHLLSFVINNGFQQNFNMFINSYRVEEFKKRIIAGAAKQKDIASIAEDVGFNSTATFYKVFRKITAQTPRQYIKGLGID